ncbi:hypothetical protein GCM10027592_40110 [Spirosoma flavus]
MALSAAAAVSADIVEAESVAIVVVSVDIVEVAVESVVVSSVFVLLWQAAKVSMLPTNSKANTFFILELLF